MYLLASVNALTAELFQLVHADNCADAVDRLLIYNNFLLE